MLRNSISLPLECPARKIEAKRGLHVMGRLLRRSTHLGRMYQGGAGRLRRRDVSRECWQEASVGYGFKTGSQLDQRGLAESGSDETDAHGHAQYVRRGHINDGISRPPG